MSGTEVIDDVQQDATDETTAPQDPIERKLREVLGDDEEPAQADANAADPAGEAEEPAGGEPDATATDDAADVATFTPRHLNAAQRFGLTQEDLAALGQGLSALAQAPEAQLGAVDKGKRAEHGK